MREAKTSKPPGTECISPRDEVHSVRLTASNSAVRLYDDTWSLDFHSDHFETCKTVKSLCYTPENNMIPSQFYFNKIIFIRLVLG